MPPKKKTGLENAPIFKGRTRAVPRETWQTLTVRTEGNELSEKLEEWGAEIKARPAATILISARETTGRICGSRFVLRGDIFMAGANPLPAKTIWPELE